MFDDFITFFCHTMVHADNQLFANYSRWCGGTTDENSYIERVLNTLKHELVI